jgi:hypothetical protein
MVMKIDARFPRQVGLALLIACGLAAYPLWKFATREVIVAVAAGIALSTVNVLVGFLTIEFSFERSYTTFLKAVLGGMGVRMMVMLGATAVLIVACGLHPLALTVSLLALYLVYMVLEILFIQRKVAAKNRD